MENKNLGFKYGLANQLIRFLFQMLLNDLNKNDSMESVNYILDNIKDKIKTSIEQGRKETIDEVTEKLDDDKDVLDIITQVQFIAPNMAMEEYFEEVKDFLKVMFESLKE